jgi:Cu(I)/Ag(I) efflux system membrane fusion protein
MKTIKKISVLSILFMVMAACNTKDKEDHSKHNKSTATTFYTCSMDPQVKEDKPGKCPICHMELTPIKQDDTEANEISLSKQQIQL